MAEPVENFKKFLQIITAGNSLTEEESSQAFDILMSGKAADGQIGAFLMAFAMRGETVEEITGAAKIMRRKARTITAPPGPGLGTKLQPDVLKRKDARIRRSAL